MIDVFLQLTTTHMAFYIQILRIGTDRSQQKVQTMIRLLLQKQSDQGLRCLPFGCINAMLHQTFLFSGQLWQLFEVSQIFNFYGTEDL